MCQMVETSAWSLYVPTHCYKGSPGGTYSAVVWEKGQADENFKKIELLF